MIVYDTVAYAQSRLNETIIRYKDKPVLVIAVSGTDNAITIQYQDLLSDVMGIDGISKFNFDPVPLGYTNHKHYAHYLMRAPMRRDWRQGLRMLNLITPSGESPRLIPFRTIAQTIIGSFPSLKTTLNTISMKDTKTVSMAFTREFALVKNQLEYKGMFMVGEVNLDNGNIKVNDKFGWVRESLEESLVGV